MGTVIEKAAPAYAIAAALILLAAGCDDFNRPLEPYVRENLSKVRAISVSPAQAGVSLGRSRQFTAAVTAFYDATTTVTWSVTGGGGGTSIDTEGLLTVGAGESEATRLTVRAVSTWDPRKSAQAVVTVRGPYTVTFDPGGGTWSGASPPSSVIYNYGETPVSEPGPGAGLIAPPGFTLAGWYTAAGGGSPVSFPYRPEADTTLYARWKSPGGPVGSAASWAAAINAVNAAPTPGNYVIDIGANSFAVDPSGNPGNNPIVDVNRTLTITGTGTISLGMAGPLLDLATGVDITLNGPTLRGTGSGSNSTPVVRLTGGSFTLQNGSIKNNNNTGNGGGVYIANAGTVTMSGGSIAGNIASSGGGVFIQGGTFTMSGGSITNNTGDSAGGGGVFISTSGTFIMNGGTITRNTGDSAGGGGVVVNRIFTLNTPASTGSIRDNLPPSSQAQVLKLGLGEINGTANPPPNGW